LQHDQGRRWSLQGDIFKADDQAEFKIDEDHSYEHSWPAENALIVFPEDGDFNVGITFNPNTNDEVDRIRVSLDLIPNK
jgi:hypothetical protein